MHTTETVAKKKKGRKLLRGVLLAVLILIVAAAAAVWGVWHHEIRSVLSMKQLSVRDDDHQDGAVYQMNISGGYYFDEFLEQGGASSDAELIDFITGRITRGLLKLNISESNIGCSSFTGATDDGDRLFARNYDFSKTNTCIVFTNPGGGRHASVSTVDLQFLGIDQEKDVSGLMDKITCLAAAYTPLDGMNDAGVSCGIYMTYQGDETVATDQNTDRPDLTSTTMLRMILDYADDVDEAVAMISEYDLHDSANTSYHYMVADASGKSAILEWVAGTDATDNGGSQRELVVTYNDTDTAMGTSDYQCVTNFIVNPGYYDGISSEEQKGLDRYEHIHERLKENGGIFQDEADAMTLLSEVGRRTWNNDDKNSCTVHSVVYNLTEKTVLWTGNEHYGEDGYVFTFEL